MSVFEKGNQIMSGIMFVLLVLIHIFAVITITYVKIIG